MRSKAGKGREEPTPPTIHFMVGRPTGVSQGLLRNKLDTTGDVIFYDNKAKNAGIAIATVRLFNTVSVKKNKPE